MSPDRFVRRLEAPWRENFDGEPSDEGIRYFHELRSKGVKLMMVGNGLLTDPQLPESETDRILRNTLDIMVILLAVEQQDIRALAWLGGGVPDPPDSDESRESEFGIS